jgi:hypothetical protein
MAEAEVVQLDSADASTAQQFVADMSAVASRASALAHDVCPPPPFSRDASTLPIEIEVRGFDERVTVAAPAGPGSVRGAVEKTLRRLGLPIVKR